MNWISVKDRLPEKEGRYYTKFADGSEGENYFMLFDDDKDLKWYHNETILGGVEYWAELPKEAEQ